VKNLTRDPVGNWAAEAERGGENAQADEPASLSTDGQSTALQRLDLVQACKHRGWEVTEVYEDAGISGAKGREGRPAFERLCQLG